MKISKYDKELTLEDTKEIFDKEINGENISVIESIWNKDPKGKWVNVTKVYDSEGNIKTYINGELNDN